MAFVNEYIPSADMEKYGIKSIDKKVGISRRTNSDDWTIDRDRNIYLRNVAQGREEFRSESGWTFLWGGELFWVEISLLEASSNGRGTPAWARKRITTLCLFGSGQPGLPDRLLNHKKEILADLRDALEAYKDGGVFAASTSYRLILEIGGAV